MSWKKTASLDPNFTEFITIEYGLLRQILSYLKPCDLHSVRFVCRDWRKAVDSLVDKNPLIISYKHGQEDPMPYPTKPILPDLVIYQNVVSKKFLRPNKCEVCKRNFLVCYCQVTGPDTAVVSLNNLKVRTAYNPELYFFWQIPSVFVLSSPKNINISTYTCCSQNKHTLTERSQGIQDELKEPIKGIFVVSKRRCRKATETLLNEFVERQGLSFAVGGGIAGEFFYKHREQKEQKKNGFVILFRGDNVSAQSELITGTDLALIEKSMAELKQRAGEVPEGGTRIAFIAQCVDRRGESLEKLEAGLFRKYFPNVPQCGFPAWGEFGIKNGSSDILGPRNESKRSKLDFCHAYTTSILILTLRKS